MRKAVEEGFIYRRDLGFAIGKRSLCIKHRKYRQNGPSKGLVWGKGGNEQKAKHQEEIDF